MGLTSWLNKAVGRGWLGGCGTSIARRSACMVKGVDHTTPGAYAKMWFKNLRRSVLVHQSVLPRGWISELQDDREVLYQSPCWLGDITPHHFQSLV